MARRGTPQVITNARPSADEQLRSRQRRYLTMMSVRAALLIIGAVLASAEVPLLWLWLTLCGVGMVLLPWLAVLIANDRPARTREERARRPVPRDSRSLGESPAGQVIDADQ